MLFFLEGLPYASWIKVPQRVYGAVSARIGLVANKWGTCWRTNNLVHRKRKHGAVSIVHPVCQACPVIQRLTKPLDTTTSPFSTYLLYICVTRWASNTALIVRELASSFGSCIAQWLGIERPHNSNWVYSRHPWVPPSYDTTKHTAPCLITFFDH